MTHVVSDDEDIGEFIAHAGVIGSHESRVDDDTHRDEQVDESVHYEQFHHQLHQLQLQQLEVQRQLLQRKPLRWIGYYYNGIK